LTLVVLALAAPLLLTACGAPPPSVAPAPTALRPAIRIDPTWTAVDGEWTFTGQVDPFGEPTDVVLEAGPAPASARVFDTELPVAQGLTEAGPLTIATRELPNADEVCVRFSASNSAGTTSSTPLCFARAVPSVVAAAPGVEIDERWTEEDGEWSFTGRIDPEGEPTDVVLEIGPGPAAEPTWDSEVAAAQDLLEPAALTVASRNIPDSAEACVRFTATNDIGTNSSEPLCFRPGDAAHDADASP
jgi:hypothetical protein